MSKKERKTYNLSNINELNIGDSLEVFDRDTGETKIVKAVDRAEISATLAYMVGIDTDKWNGYYERNYSNLLVKLLKDKDATIIRYLCKIRTTLMRDFLEIDGELLYGLKNIDTIDKFDTDEVKQLIKWNIPVILINSRAESYVRHISELISKYIDNCKRLFPLSVKYEYIRSLFVIPNKKEVYKEEYNKFKGHRCQYPYQCYIYWKPGDYGYIFKDDKALLENIYNQNGDHFYDGYKLRNASQTTKHTIYDFIGKAHQIAIVVDCENSDPYKLCSFINSLDDESKSHISQIVLYDDTHTTIGWRMLEKFVSIPVQYNLVERVTENKSLVDMEMAVGVTRAHTTKAIDSFILCSSDSDFWGLISSLPEARYLILYEYSKCGSDIKDAWSRREILNYALDDFYSGMDDKLREAVLLKILSSSTSDIIGEEPMEFAKKIFRDAYIPAEKDEIRQFCQDHIMNLSLKIGEDGRFFIG